MPRITHNHAAVAANHSLYQNELLNETHTTLREIATNTKNINLNVDTVEVSVDALEVLQAQTNTTLAAMLVDTDAIDSSCNTIEAQSVLTASRLNNIQNSITAAGDGSGDKLGVINTNILAKNGEIETSLNSLISANHTDLVALESSLTSMEGKIDTLDTVQDNALSKLNEIATNTANINVNVGDVEVNTNDLEVLQASTNSKLDSILSKNGEIETSANALIAANHTDLVALEASLTSMEGKQDSLVSANHTDLVALEASLTSMEGKQDDIKTLIGTTNSGLSSIDSGINDLDTLLGDIQTDNNSKSDHLSGNLDTLNGKIDTLTTRIKLANSDAHLAVSLEDIGGVATQTTLAAAEAHLGNIETAVQLLDNALDGNYLNVNQNISGTDVSSNSGNKDAQTQRFCLATDDVPTGLTNTILNAVNGSIGTGNTALSAIKTAVEVLDNCVSGSEFQVDVVSSALPSGASTETTLAAAEAHLGNIDTGVDVLEACVGSNKVNVNISSGNISGFATQTTLASVLAKNTEIETSANAIQSAVEGTLTVGSHAVTNAGTFAVQSTIAAALPAGTNAIGKLAANSGVDIGDVDVTSISAGTNRIGMVGMKANQAADGTGTERFVLCDAAGHLQVDVLSGGGSTDVSGVATHAKQDTIIGHLDGVEGKLDAIETTNNACQVLLGTIDADTGAIKTAVQILDNAISGNEMQVDIVSSALPSGAATQTTLASVLAKNTEIETTADAILAKNTQLETLLTSIAHRTATATLSAATNLADDGALAIVDTAGYKYMTIFGKATNYVDLYIQYSLTNSAGAMISIYNTEAYRLQSNQVNSIEVFNNTIEHMPRYVRFINLSGSQINALTLYYQLSN